MAGVNKYQPLGDEGNYPRLYVTKEQQNVKISLGRGVVTSNKAVEVAAKQLGFLKTLFGKKDTVKIKAEDAEGKLVDITMKVSDLAKALGVNPVDIVIERENNNVEGYIQQRLKQIANLASLGLTLEELETIEEFYESEKGELEKFNALVHIRKSDTDPQLPRSLVYDPTEPGKGLYVLLKTKGGVEELGVGSFNRASKMYHLETGEVGVFRSARKEHVFQGEIEANKEASKYPQYFIAGNPVEYRGSWTPREGREINISKAALPKEHDVEKVAILMEMAQCGELFDRLCQQPPLTYKEAVYIAWKLAEGLACFHDDVGMVHLDLKPENILLTNSGEPKITDFGFAEKSGGKLGFRGTPGYIAPQICSAGLTGLKFVADPKCDIWAMGCILSALLHGGDWIDGTRQGDGDFQSTMMPNRMEPLKKKIFMEKDPQSGSYVYRSEFDRITAQCLELLPKDRPTAKDLAVALGNHYQGL